MGTSIELRGSREKGFRLSERSFEGVGRAEYETICKLTDDEADCLVQAGFVSPPYGMVNGKFQDEPMFLTETNPRSYISVRDFDLMRGYHDKEDKENAVHGRSVVITLPADPRLKREAIEFADPTYRYGSGINQAKWLEPFLTTDEEPDKEKAKWPDNPAECNSSW